MMNRGLALISFLLATIAIPHEFYLSRSAGRFQAVYADQANLRESVTTEEADPSDWWDTRWRYRTRVQRSAPYRDGAVRAVEAAVDLPLLLEKAGIPGEVDPESIRVIEADGREMPSAFRPEAGARSHYVTWLTEGQSGAAHIYFDTRDAGIAPADYDDRQLPPVNLLHNADFEDGLESWEVEPRELASFGRFADTTGRQSLRLVVDENSGEADGRTVTIRQRLNVKDFAGREMVFECDWLAERAPYGAPISVEIRQYRPDGSRILEYAVEPRWLTLELAEGQPVRLSQRGRFSPEAAIAEVCLLVRCYVIDGVCGGHVEGPESHFTIWLDRVTLRASERWPWPDSTNAGFVEGAIAGAPLNRGFEFTGRRRLFFTGASEGPLTAWELDPGPESVHWGLGAGTLEFWCRPGWDPDDGVERVFFMGYGYLYRLQSRLRKLGAGGENRLEFVIADGDRVRRRVTGPAPLRKGEWSHIAATWNFSKAHLQLFIDGKLVGEEGPGEASWPFSLTAQDPRARHLGIGISENDKRSLPMQAFIGGRMAGKKWPYDGSAEAVIDEFRISDVVRYSADFTPRREEFELDPSTRALWHFENERDGIHHGGDQLVRSYLGVEEPPRKERAPLDILEGGTIERRMVEVNPRAPEELFAANRGRARLEDENPFREMPDPRFVEYRRRTAGYTIFNGSEEFSLEVGGDFPPLMERVIYRLAPGSSESTLLPRWRANDNVVPFSQESLRDTLAPGVENEAEKALEVMKYALATTAYYDADYCETLPCGRHRPRVGYTLIRALNIYPFDQCGPANFTLKKLFLTAGISSNDFRGTHHHFQQSFYDGDFRLFDIAPRMYWLNRDNETVASLRNIGEDPHCKLREPGNLNSFFPGGPSSAAFRTAHRPHRIDLYLRPGENLEVGWMNRGRWFELSGRRRPIPLARIPPRFGNGMIEYRPTLEGGASVFDNLEIRGSSLQARDPSRPAVFIYRVTCPYIFSDGIFSGFYTAGEPGAIRLSLSFDRGRTWTRVWENPGLAGLMKVRLREQISARYEYWLRVELDAGGDNVLEDPVVRTVFVNSDLSLPGRLALGDNRITFVAAEPKVPVQTTCTWVERYRTDLGVSLNALDYYNLDYDRHRNLWVVPPGGSRQLEVAVEGRALKGTVSIEGLPTDWSVTPSQQEIAVADGAEPAYTGFLVTAPERAEGRITPLEVVVRGEDRERRVPAEVLSARSPLVREAEAADGMSEEVEILEIPDASGRRAVLFAGRGELEFDLDPAEGGTYALWLRARWEPNARARLFLDSGEGGLREVIARRLFGVRDWTDTTYGFTKGFLHHPGDGNFEHWAWYRIPEVAVPAGRRRLTLIAEAGAYLDALLLLPETPGMNRAGMNLFHNWNYGVATADWESNVIPDFRF